MNVRINDELTRWVLGLGPSARVLAPESLKDAVVEMLKDIDAAYHRTG